VPTIICDATGDAEVLKKVWPELIELEPKSWQQLPRPSGVRIIQCVHGHTFSKSSIADPTTMGTARAAYAAVIVKACEYDGAEVGVITYKTTEDWLKNNCFIPKWMKFTHWGDDRGTNELQHVRALFVVGRPLPQEEVITRQAEALAGAHIPERKYVERIHGGRIPIMPNAAGENCILVNRWEHPNPIAERLRREVTEAGLIQAAGRARWGLRGEGEPLDIWLFTNVAVPELGAVEPKLWSELDGGLDGLMLAQGCWLENAADAAKVYKGLMTVAGVQRERARSGGLELLSKPLARALVGVKYLKMGMRQKPWSAVFVRGFADPQRFLQDRLGKLAAFVTL
jgi:hypothetical protein